jgi:hypothetical protein
MLKHVYLLVLTALMLFGNAVLAHARECRGVNFPDQVRLEGSTLTLNGLGMRKATFLKINVYVAALYVAGTSNDPDVILGSDTPKELILHFVRDVDGSDLAEAWDEGFAKNAKAQLPALKERIATLKGWMADVKTGQQLIFEFKPGSGIQVATDGAVKGTIKGDDFAQVLLSIWLGADPPNPEVKAGLLGGSCS